MERIDLYDKPIEILNEFENRGYAGMSDFELSFLCGALKKLVLVNKCVGTTYKGRYFSVHYCQKQAYQHKC